jgi:hypothetical protein
MSDRSDPVKDPDPIRIRNHNTDFHVQYFLFIYRITWLQVMLYVMFFVIMVRIYTLPLFAVRPMYLTMRAFKKVSNGEINRRPR